MHFKVQGQERQQADFIMADSGNNNISAVENNCVENSDSVEKRRKNSSDSSLLNLKSASMSVIKKGIKMGATGFSTQVKRKTAANPGLSWKLH